MVDLQNFLKQMIRLPGLSGFEGPIRSLIQETWRPLVDEISVSKIGSIHAYKRGQGDSPRLSILIATHMDAIGLMVTRVQDGFIWITEIGGIDARVLPGQPVTVHGREDFPGLVVEPPKWLRAADSDGGATSLEELLVDTGLPLETLAEQVRVGDLVSFAQPPIEMGNTTLAGHSLDNRASVAALTHCLQELNTLVHQWDVWAVATVQEEESLGGAFTSAFDLRPSLAIAIDVTFGNSPGVSGHKSFPVGKGPVLGVGPNIHTGMYRAFKTAAERIEMPVQHEIMPAHSGTDAYALQVAEAGIPTMVVSIPLRYMHTPVEVISTKDVTRVGRLLAEFIRGLDGTFMEKLSWDE